MIPIDRSLAIAGLDFLRYADDILIFCQNDREVKTSVNRLAHTLDKQQRLTLQKHKTKTYDPIDFRLYAQQTIEDRPINSTEARLLDIVERYSSGSPYASISYNQIDANDWAQFSPELVEGIIEEYLGSTEIDFIRLRWFYRRLAQVGHPGAVNITLSRMAQLEPCFASICTYFSSLQTIEKEAWNDIGSKFLTLLDLEEVKESEYFKLSILSLFSRNGEINHFRELRSAYAGSDAFAKREIILAAKESNAVDWIRELKEDFELMDPWQKRAFAYVCSDLPSDEKKYFLRRWSTDRPFDKTLASWSAA